ncbi:MAG TPA: hypothetical protein VN986_06575 [Actinomycetota bacterium]|nr:hypothetical protein [Actinomycetota bacterium]
MALRKVAGTNDVRLHVARNLADYAVPKGPGELGTLSIALERNLTRTFKAHWTGFKLLFPRPTVLLSATLHNGMFWSEGYISPGQPSWVLAFRRDPPKARGSGGPRPDDKLGLEASIVTSLAQRHKLIDSGQIPHEELIRMEDFDDPLEAVDEFFNYTAWYVLRAVDAEWDQLGYVPEPSIGWGADEDRVAELGSDAAAQEEQRLVTARDTVDIPPVKLRSRAERTVPQPKDDAPNELLTRIARRLSEYMVPKGPGELGTLSIAQERNITRTFKAHWTGFRLVFPKRTILLSAMLSDGTFWSEGYIGPGQPSWVLAFRRDPPKARGSGGPRPDDKLGLEASITTSLAQRHKLIDSGQIPHEELIRMEDFDDPLEAVDEFFNYTAWYVLRAVDAEWDQLGYVPEASARWRPDEDRIATLPLLPAIEEGLKRSDIIWVTPDTSNLSLPCWFVYRNGKIWVLSAEPQQIIPDAGNVREAKVALRWKGRDARLVDFDASVRVIGPENTAEFEEIGALLVAKRQSISGSVEDIVTRWMSAGVILELTPLL